VGLELSVIISQEKLYEQRCDSARLDPACVHYRLVASQQVPVCQETLN